MMLVDTSVWVDYFRGDETHETGRLVDALSGDEELCICGLILTEILQGIPSPKQYRRVKRLLKSLIYLPVSREAHILAADIYRGARATGKTIRNSVDCIIAACAISHNTPLLQSDRDFPIIKAVSKLRLIPA